MMPPRRPLLITRPIEQGRQQLQSLQAALPAAARPFELFPLLEIAPLPPAQQAQLHAALASVRGGELLAFVSPNAIAAANAALLQGNLRLERQVLLGVMGQGSARALQAAPALQGLRVLAAPPAQQDSQGLLQTLHSQACLPAQGGALRSALILRGQDGREWLAEALQAAGVTVRQQACYLRHPVAPEPARLQTLRAWLAQECCWLISSSQALRHLLDLCAALCQMEGPAAPDYVAKMKQQTLLLPHPRIVQNAQALGFAAITPYAGSDVDLLAALQSLP
ncbi:uroporphyrinogen-III synthase [Massilia sp. W12]|uniref:uroporphyrinogen-III synthase n=1 Tax=Massilia sp. W12 TaxID=3126507 RepID=UPI0030CDC9EB